MAFSSSSYASTKETTNYARLCRLVVDIGSQTLRKTFDVFTYRQAYMEFLQSLLHT